MSPILAQTREPEVRRALPAGAPEIPVAPAVPFDPVPAAPTPSKEPPTAPAVPANPASPAGEIVVAPQTSTVSPDKATLEAANGFYSRQMWELATTEYEKYMRSFPQGPDREEVMYRLAQCYLEQKRGKPARDFFESLLIDYPRGSYSPYAAHRLGTIYFNDANYRGALPMFQKAGSLGKEPKLVLDSKFNEAKTMEMLGNRNETIQVYLEIIGTAGENPYKDVSRRSLASRLTELGRLNDALAQYDALSKEASNPELRAEAAVKAAGLATQLEKPEVAAQYYEYAAKIKGGGKWAGIAATGLLQSLYDAGKYQEVIKTFTEAQALIPPDAMPAALILVGNAMRKLGQYQEAQATYARIPKEFPDSPEANQAAFQRLVSLYQQKDEKLVAEIDSFVAKYPDSEEARQARLLKAELYFSQGKFAEAGPIYLLLSTSSLDPKFRAEALFKLGFCYSKVPNHEKAVEAYSMFIGEFRKSPLLPAAYLQRGIEFQQLKNYERALADFDTLILSFPKSKERETALRQKALIFGQKEQNPQMVAAFQLLLRDYPQSQDAGMAWYWIGSADYELKQYEKALEPLQKSRTIDKDYYARATLKIVVCLYSLERVEALQKEIDEYVGSKSMPPVPTEILGWLGIKLLELNKTADAVRYLTLAAQGVANPDVYLTLGRAQVDLGNWKEAIDALNQFLKTATSPVSRAQGLLVLGEAQIGIKDYPAARKSAEQVQLLQPEGRLNAEGRLLSGDIEFAAGSFPAAAKLYSTVAILYDDPAITPAALEKAAEAFKKAGKTAEAQKMLDELKQRFPDYKSTTGSR